MTDTDGIWHAAPLVAIDLEGSGGQDRDAEAILEIAVVPLDAGRPRLTGALSTLVNPGRPIAMRPWLSPGLTNLALGAAPPIGAVEPELAALLDGRYLVGHNVRVDWRLLRRHCATITPAGLIDTLRLARQLHLADGKSLTSLLRQLHLVDQVNTAAPHSRPHRALWDTVAVALLLPALIARIWPSPPTLTDLLHRAAVTAGDHSPASDAAAEAPDTLF